MANESARSAAETHFLAGWTDAPPATRTPVALANVKGLVTQTTGGGLIRQPPRTDPWVRFGQVELPAGPASLGRNPIVRTVGRLFVQIFVPRGTGTSTAKTLGDQAIELLELQTIGGELIMYAPDGPLQDVGPTEHWWQYNVSVPYRRDRVGQVA